MFSELINYELLQVGDYKLRAYQPLLLIVIMVLTPLFLQVIKRILERKSKNDFELGRRHSIFLIVKYVVWVIVIALGLEILGVQVTLLLAGSAALLVGLGFGIQQVFNDFVCGFLLLVEGTIQVNDIIEVDGIVARVKEINLRASKVMTRDDTTIIIPNHKFISENVINWSNNHGLTRFSVKVGVAYGTDVDHVIAILNQVLHEQAEVSKEEDYLPAVRFLDFGESSLDFELLFYTTNIFRVKNIQSQVRCLINRKFIEHNIVIPFPQRDVHISTSNISTTN